MAASVGSPFADDTRVGSVEEWQDLSRAVLMYIRTHIVTSWVRLVPAPLRG
jgi:hypothetical protein